jgi:type I restriction enzyme M protein
VRYERLLERLEISIVSLSKVWESAATRRIDPEYFQKQYLADQALVEERPTDFQSFADVGLTVDASAFYPAIEEFYGTGNLPFLRVADVDSVIDFENCTRIPSELCDRFPTLTRVHNGDIVLTKGGSVARVGLVTEEAAASRDLIILNSSKLSAPERTFLYLYAQTAFFKRVLLRSSSQTAQPHLTITLVRNLPTLRADKELKDRCLQLVEQAYATRAEAIYEASQAEGIVSEALGLAGWNPPDPLAYTRRASEAFTAGRIDAEHFRPKFAALVEKMKLHGKVVRLGDYLDFCERGRQPNYADDGLPVVNSRHVRGGVVELNSQNRFANEDPAQLKLNEEKRTTIKQGDVLMNGTGVGTLGRCAVYLYENKALPDNHITILRPMMDADLDPVFLGAQLNSVVGQMQVEQYFKGSSGQIELYPTDIKQFRIWLAPQEIQLRIRDHIEAGHRASEQAQAMLDWAKRAVEIAIEDSEAAALQHLRES